MNVHHFASFIFVRKCRVESSEISVLGSEINQHIIAGVSETQNKTINSRMITKLLIVIYLYI